MGRQMPEYCEHGTLVCAGDFADPEDVQECPLCHIESLPVKIAAKDARIAELEAENRRLKAVAEAAVALLEPDTDESYPSIDYAKQERCKQLLRLALHAAGYLK